MRRKLVSLIKSKKNYNFGHMISYQFFKTIFWEINLSVNVSISLEVDDNALGNYGIKKIIFTR